MLDDVYRKIQKRERMEMQERMEKNVVKFAGALDEEMLPKMPKGGDIKSKRDFLGIYATRQAKLQMQIDWLHAEQERHRKLQEAV